MSMPAEIARARDLAHMEGYDAGYDAGYTAGHEEGYSLGYAHALALAKNEADALKQDLDRLADVIRQLERGDE